jgi:serine/threonine-protein kinase
MVKRMSSREELFGPQLLDLQFEAEGRLYKLAGKLGDGAIGVVRKAVDCETKNIVAVKFLAPEPKYIDEEALEDIYRRFRREGERGTSLNHNNLVEVISYQENKNGENFKTGDNIPTNPFILMELIQGRTLEDYIRLDKGIPHPCFNINRTTLTIAHEISQALIYLHQRGLVHRDVKPANIFLTRARPGTIPHIVKLGDFGIVKWGDYRATISTGTLTTTGQKGLGTLKYMAFEQAIDPQSVGVKSDMYSVGITLYELFTNQVLPDIHHVFQIDKIRQDRSYRTIDTKCLALGLGTISPSMRRYELLLETILDMFLKPSGRPSSKKLGALLNFYLQSLDADRSDQ